MTDEPTKPKLPVSFCDSCHRLDRVAKRGNKILCRKCFVAARDRDTATLAAKAAAERA